MERRTALLIVALLGALARAEGVSARPPPGTAKRLSGVAFMKAMPDGRLVALGGPMLRILPPGASKWETLHQQPGDDLYRVGWNDAGDLLASWEKDPFIHYFTRAPRQHVAIPTPAAPSKDIFMFHVQNLVFLPNGREAIVHMQGLRPGGGWRELDAAFKVALDGKTPPTMLYLVDSAFQVNINAKGALFAMPQAPGKQECTARVCHPVAAIVAYDFTDAGVTQKTLLEGSRAPISGVQLLSPRDDDPVVLLLELDRSNRGLLRWRRGEEPTFGTYPRSNEPSERFLVTKAGEVIELVIVSPDHHLEVRRYAPDGSSKVTALQSYGIGVEFGVHGTGFRADGSLWVHLGNKLMLISPDKPVRAYDLGWLGVGRPEWASASAYLPNPEQVWLGIEGRGRQFVGVSFADVEKRAEPWPSH